MANTNSKWAPADWTIGNKPPPDIGEDQKAYWARCKATVLCNNKPAYDQGVKW